MKKNTKNYLKILFTVLIILIIWAVIRYEIQQEKLKQEAIKIEQENIKIDEYNFQQLEKAKPVLENIPEDAKVFYWLKEFNSIYKANIQPIKNCYFVGLKNWKEKYIFWFKLESKKYISQYRTEYFAYPKYDIPVDEICTWHCYDANRPYFEYLISHPCKD